MKTSIVIILFCLCIWGCQNEPTTLREEAERAQENLEVAREQAAEVIADSEEEAVEIVADARQKSREGIQEAKREAGNIIADAKENLTDKLDELGESTVIESEVSSENLPE